MIIAFRTFSLVLLKFMLKNMPVYNFILSSELLLDFLLSLCSVQNSSTCYNPSAHSKGPGTNLQSAVKLCFADFVLYTES